MIMNLKNWRDLFFIRKSSKIKAWHYHELMTLNYAVVDGEIKLVLFDNRPESKSKGNSRIYNFE